MTHTGEAKNIVATFTDEVGKVQEVGKVGEVGEMGEVGTVGTVGKVGKVGKVGSRRASAPRLANSRAGGVRQWGGGGLVISAHDAARSRVMR